MESDGNYDISYRDAWKIYTTSRLTSKIKELILDMLLENQGDMYDRRSMFQFAPYSPFIDLPAVLEAHRLSQIETKLYYAIHPKMYDMSPQKIFDPYFIVIDDGWYTHNDLVTVVNTESERRTPGRYEIGLGFEWIRCPVWIAGTLLSEDLHHGHDEEFSREVEERRWDVRDIEQRQVEENMRMFGNAFELGRQGSS